MEDVDFKWLEKAEKETKEYLENLEKDITKPTFLSNFMKFFVPHTNI